MFCATSSMMPYSHSSKCIFISHGMEITINHTKKNFEKLPENLLDLLVNELHSALSGIAVAVNNTIIPKNLWEQTPVKENDQILIITATQGG